MWGNILIIQLRPGKVDLLLRTISHLLDLCGGGRLSLFTTSKVLVKYRQNVANKLFITRYPYLLHVTAKEVGS